MKTRRSLLVAIGLAILGALVAWFLRGHAGHEEKIAATSMPSAGSPSPVMPSKQGPAVNSPALPLAKASSPAASAISAPAPVESPAGDNADPQANLKTAFADMARLMRSGDIVTFYETYSRPGTFTPAERQRLQTIMDRHAITPDPEDLARHVEIAVIFEEFINQQPEFNGTGDEATFYYTPPSHLDDQQPPVATSDTFVRINGKWYLK